MTQVMKMRAIRKAHSMTQLSLAVAMNCSSSTVDNYENGRNPVSDHMYKAFKKATGMEGVPLTGDEIVAFKKEQLYAWNFMINYGDINQAKELQSNIGYCVMWSYDTELQVLYDIFCINYHSKIDEMEDSDKIVASLKKREHELTDEQRYWHCRYLGVLEHRSWRCKPAINMYMKAEEIGGRLGLNDTALYYNISDCLTFMGYPYLSIVYLQKIQLKEFNISNVSYGFATQRLLAVNYSKLGRICEALELLEKYREYLLCEMKDGKYRLGIVYHSIGWVYQNAEDFEKTLENYDLASQHYDKKSELYIRYLCDKASLLRTHNRNDEAKSCVDKGLSMVAEGTLWYEWLNAIKHSLVLDKKGSVEYIQWAAIPKFHEYGKHTLAMECYEWLSDNCRKNGMYKSAGEYSEQAFGIYKQLMKGDLSL